MLGTTILCLSVGGAEGASLYFTVNVHDTLSVDIHQSPLFNPRSVELVNCSLAFCDLFFTTNLTMDAGTGIAVKDNYAYITTETGLRIVDVSDPYSPFIVSNVSTTYATYGVVLEGDYAYVAADNGLQIVNISNPLSPSLVSTFEMGAQALTVALHGNTTALVGVGNGFLERVGIEDPLSPTFQGSAFVGTTNGIALKGNYAFVSASINGLIVTNAQDLSNTFFVPLGTATGVDIKGNFAYVSTLENGLQVVNIAVPLSSNVSQTLPTLAVLNDVVVEGSYAFLSARQDGIQRVDISDPLSPILSVKTGDTTRLAVVGNNVYSLNPNGLTIVHDYILVARPNTMNRNEETIFVRECNLMGVCTDPYSIQICVPNRFPSLLYDGETAITFHVRDSHLFSLVFLDLDWDELNITVSPLPAGWSFSSNQTNERADCLIGGTLVSGAQGNWRIDVQGFDGYGGSDSLLLEVHIPNRDPVLSFPGDPFFDLSVGDLFPFPFAFTDLDWDPLNVTVSSLPPGWSFSSSSSNERTDCFIEGTLQPGAEGNWTIEVIGDDGYGGFDSLLLRLSIGPEPTRPQSAGELGSEPSGLSSLGLVLIVLSIAFVVGVLLSLLGIFLYRKRRKSQVPDKTEVELVDGTGYSGQMSLSTSWEIPFSHLKFKQEVGRGSFGVVYLGTWRKQRVAIKKILNGMNDTKQMEEFRKEVALMTQIRPHPNVVLLLGVCTTKELCIVTEYLPQGSVWEYIQKNEIDMDQTLQWAKDIASGMTHLHAEGVVHRDLACRNLLLTENLQAKVSDFGLARVSDNAEGTNLTQSTVGPVKWMAPECLKSQKYSTKSDVWAWGITMIEILTRSPPYPDMNPMSVCVGVVSEGLRHPIPSHTPPELELLLQRAFQTDPKDRPEFSQICDELENLGNVEHVSKGLSETDVHYANVC